MKSRVNYFWALNVPVKVGLSLLYVSSRFSSLTPPTFVTSCGFNVILVNAGTFSWAENARPKKKKTHLHKDDYINRDPAED